MKKTLITLIYSSLSLLVLVYLFKLMSWPGLADLSKGVFWLHVGSYLGYSFFVNPKDDRIIYPLILLVGSIAFNTFQIEVGLWFTYVVFGLLWIYVSFHLLVKNYLATSNIPFLTPLNYLAIILFGLAGIFKMNHLAFTDTLFVSGSASLCFLLILAGITKGIERKKMNK
jgi:hypothetical protein